MFLLQVQLYISKVLSLWYRQSWSSSFQLEVPHRGQFEYPVMHNMHWWSAGRIFTRVLVQNSHKLNIGVLNHILSPPLHTCRHNHDHCASFDWQMKMRLRGVRILNIKMTHARLPRFRTPDNRKFLWLHESWWVKQC